MRRSSQVGMCAATLLLIAGASPAANAQDFFSALFGGLVAPQRAEAPPMVTLPYADERGVVERPAVSSPPVRSVASGGSQAYCVRTCDGRYFPLSATGGQSKAGSCNSFCPASETKVVYGGGTIDNAVTKSGKRYSELPNAFKYRSEIVAGCTCNGKDQFGLAKVPLDDDPTVHKGDMIATQDGLMVARGGTGGDRELKLSRVSGPIRAGSERVPVVASD
ncbi:MAG: DUF2865 domain-containing protein [Rhodopseudomonas sp.]|uniref:DUF2865 domain-containing protein n=1 Tax=Rhodopseudomonas sp. TaxID=1078 RepID=UPI001822FE39|nr:DUF2865 domain-containing protein [Rhodopseudomonas sp.]NVN88023.1 DUF2865 domain-containing protein [Rhodopseudomonas sp.]